MQAAIFRTARIGLTLLLLFGVDGVRAQDIAPPEPPLVPAPPPPSLNTRQVSWTPYHSTELGFSADFPTSAITSKDWLGHIGFTQLITSDGLRLGTSVEHTTLFNSLQELTLDSLSRLYWTPSFLSWRTLLSSKDTIIGNLNAKTLVFKGNSDMSVWKIIMARPSRGILLTFLTVSHNGPGREADYAAHFLGSIRIQKSKMNVRPYESAIFLSNGQHFVNDTLGYSLDVLGIMTRRPPLVQNGIEVVTWLTKASELPSIMVMTTTIKNSYRQTEAVMDGVDNLLIQQGYNGAKPIEVEGHQGSRWEKVDGAGSLWTAFVIHSADNTVNIIFTRVESYWGSAFADEVLSSVHLFAPKE